MIVKVIDNLIWSIGVNTMQQYWRSVLFNGPSEIAGMAASKTNRSISHEKYILEVVRICWIRPDSAGRPLEL
jgi:hypothetical protein